MSSSEESPQSLMPSHVWVSMTHTLFLHCHCPARQWSREQCALSDPTAQSSGPSQSSQASRHSELPGHRTFWSGHAASLSKGRSWLCETALLHCGLVYLGIYALLMGFVYRKPRVKMDVNHWRFSHSFVYWSFTPKKLDKKNQCLIIFFYFRWFWKMNKWVKSHL